MNTTTKKPFKLTKGQSLRFSLTKVATTVEDRIAAGLPVRELELAMYRAMDRKLATQPKFAWGARS